MNRTKLFYFIGMDVVFGFQIIGNDCVDSLFDLLTHPKQSQEGI